MMILSQLAYVTYISLRLWAFHKCDFFTIKCQLNDEEQWWSELNAFLVLLFKCCELNQNLILNW